MTPEDFLYELKCLYPRATMTTDQAKAFCREISGYELGEGLISVIVARCEFFPSVAEVIKHATRIEPIEEDPIDIRAQAEAIVSDMKRRGFGFVPELEAVIERLRSDAK